jgi:hypothetical protein
MCAPLGWLVEPHLMKLVKWLSNSRGQVLHVYFTGSNLMR